MKHTDRYTVDEKLFQEAHEKVEALLAEIFGLEGDHSHNVEFILIDRERYEPMHFRPVPYSHTDNWSDKALAKALEAAMFNLSTAHDTAHRVYVQTRIKASEKQKKEPTNDG